MKRKLKNCVLFSELIFLLIVIGLFLPFDFSLGQQQKVEVEYPQLPSIPAPQYVNFPIQNYLAYIYELTISIVGILCFLVLVLGGVQYLRSFGRPELLISAKRKILSSILGLLLILTSFLIAKTINPQLVKFPYYIVEPFKATPTPEVVVAPNTEVFQEIPIGTLITSERGASVYMNYINTTDPSIDEEKYFEYFLDKTPIYSTDYQGLLHGRRLMRVREVALKTHDDFATPLFYLSRSLVRTAYKCCCNKWENAGKKIETTEAGNCMCKSPDREEAPGCQTECIKPICEPEGSGCIQKKPCRGRVCTAFNEKRIKCLQKAIQVLIECYRAFLDTNYLVQDALQKVAGLLGEVGSCYSQGYITEHEYMDLLINPIQDAIRTENKGTLFPKTYERDVQTNILHLELQFNNLVEVKTMLDHLSPLGCQPQPISLNQKYQLINMPGGATPRRVTTTKFRDVKTVGEDPATFYCSYRPPYTTLELLGMLSQQKKEVIRCKGQSVEIPIGKAVDEALKLGDDLIRRLTEIWETGHTQIKLAEELIELPNPLLQPPRPADNCNIFCKSKCRCTAYDPETGECIRCRAEPCKDKGGLAQIKRSLVQKLLEIQETKRQICRFFTQINSFEPGGEPCPRKIFMYSEMCCEKEKCTPCEAEEIKQRSYSTFEKLATIQKLLNMSRDLVDFFLLDKQLQDIETYLRSMGPNMRGFELADFPQEFYKIKEMGKNLKNCDNLISQVFFQKSGREEFNVLEHCNSMEYFGQIDVSKECNLHPNFDCEFFNFDSYKPHPKIATAKPVPNECANNKRSSYLCYCFHEEAPFRRLEDQHTFFFEPGKELPITSNFFCCVDAQTPFTLNP